MIVGNNKELKALREGGGKLSGVLEMLARAAVPGITAKELDKIAENEIVKIGGRPSFKGYQPPGSSKKYPATICVSINDAVVHGIPDVQVLQSGDLVGIDIGMVYRGLYTDMALTIGIGQIADSDKKLLETGRTALDLAISKVKAGIHTGDIGYTVQRFVEKNGFGVIRELVGHGVGRAVHEDPEIPNWGKPKSGAVLRENEVIAIEPMITAGNHAIKLLSDGWTWATSDGSKAVHFEHTLVVKKDGSEVITKI